MANVSKSTKQRAVDEAKGLLQSFGFNGFSFQHIADLLGIKKPSLYDHFKSKEELGNRLIEDYTTSFKEWTQTIAVFEPADKIGALFEMFSKFSADHKKLCPMTALISDFNSIPESMRKSLARMYKFQRDWLEEVIEEGQKKKVFRRDVSSGALADMIQSLGIGSQHSARILGQPEKIRALKREALRFLEDPGT